MEYISDSARDKVRLQAPVYSGPPGVDATVYEIKEQAARLITLIEQLASPGVDNGREKALAITHIQTATMFAVFAATTPA